jgi:predicted PurR-regulated permease PerM
VAAWAVGAPSPIVLAVIVGLFDLIPNVGAGIAAVIVVLVTLAGSGATAAGILLLVIIIYQPIENYLIQPAVIGQAVDLSPFATVTVVVIGAALLGVVGAVLAVPVAAAVKVVVRDATAPRRARMAELQAAEAGRVTPSSAAEPGTPRGDPDDGSEHEPGQLP